ncbi:MAG TPA: phage major capsid protein [Gemmata sp.]
MPLTVKQLQEERAPIGAEIRRMADTLGKDKPDFTAEERGKWDKLNEDFNRMTGQIELVRRAEEVGSALGSGEERRKSKPGLEDTEPRRRKDKGRSDGDVSEEYRALALQAWARKQQGLDLSDDHTRACKRLGFSPNRRNIDIVLGRRPEATETNKRAQSAQLPSGGASLVAGGKFMGGIEKALKDYNGVREVADVIRTDDGSKMPWPTNNDTSNEGEMIGENTEVAKQDTKIGVTNFDAYKFSSKMMLLPSELLDDSAFELAMFVSELLGERIGRAQQRKFTTGRGSSEPQGVVTGSVLGKQAASGTAIAADEIIDLIHSVDPAYRRDPSFRLMFHDGILAVIRKLKDSQNRYLFEEGQGGAPDRIKGVRYAINQNMDSAPVSGAKTILAGAMRNFKVRDVKQLRLKRLDERYAELDQVAFIGFMRSDSRLLNAGTNPIKHLAHP